MDPLASEQRAANRARARVLSYRQILQQMQSWQESADREVAHAEADALLCIALEKVGAEQGVLSEIVAAWYAIGKWYA